ncbi:MAG TPA: hypothetical protein VFU98_00320 [Microlunatus sp.]|nr:hypothetical protein [Microlunatus sp.]
MQPLGFRDPLGLPIARLHVEPMNGPERIAYAVRRGRPDQTPCANGKVSSGVPGSLVGVRLTDPGARL